ncbi:MAG: hypothetical protein EXS31_01480 [Pedosphaera sp.]|nr:hypothetical protein [Pedosphaera sp.]
MKSAASPISAWEAYRDLFALIQNKRRLSRSGLVDNLNEDAKATKMPKCTYHVRATQYWETDPKSGGRSSSPRPYRAQHLFDWLTRQLCNLKCAAEFSEHLAAIAPRTANSIGSQAPAGTSRQTGKLGEEIDTFGGRLNNPGWKHESTQGASEGSPTKTILLTKVLKGKGLYRTLEDLYPSYPLLTFNGTTVPVAVFPAHGSQLKNVEAPLVNELTSVCVPGYDDYDKDFDPGLEHEFRRLRSQENSHPQGSWNGATYDMDSIVQTKRGPKLSCKMGRYFLSVSTSDTLEDELVTALSSNPDSPVTLEQLSHRKWLHDRIAGHDPVCAGACRSSAVGLTALTVFLDQNKHYCCFVHARSRAVQTYHDLFHVIPSGMFQPQYLPAEPQREFSIKHVFLREFYEELYDAKDVERDGGYPNPEHFYEKRPVKRILEMLNSDNPRFGARLYFTGLGVNLMNLRADICALLLIRDQNWFEHEGRQDEAPLKFNFEYWRADGAKSVPASPDSLGTDKITRLCPLNDQLEIIESHRKHLHSSTTVSMAAAAIQLGLKVARRAIHTEA